jgi:hypothetical protein
MLQGEDVQTCELTFTILSVPTSGGSLSPITNQLCTSGSPNSNNALLIYTHSDSDSTGDSPTHRVCDGATPPLCTTVVVSIIITRK